MPVKSSFEIIFKENVNNLFDKFFSCFNMNVGFYSPQMEELAVRQRRGCNEFCELVKNGLQKKQKCLLIDKQKRQQALSMNDLVTYPCFSGMIESIIPIYYEGMHLGYCIMGKYRNEERLNQALIDEWFERFGSSEELVLAYLKTPCFSEAQIDNIRSFFRLMVDYIVSHNLISIKSNLIIEKIVNYARENISKNLSIGEAADIVGRCESTISHIFTSHLKKSFKQVMIEIKLDRADEYFLGDSNISVKEVALQLGYDDPYYFSRIYKKYRGYAPSKFQSCIDTQVPLCTKVH